MMMMKSEIGIINIHKVIKSTSDVEIFFNTDLHRKFHGKYVHKRILKNGSYLSKLHYSISCNTATIIYDIQTDSIFQASTFTR